MNNARNTQKKIRDSFSIDVDANAGNAAKAKGRTIKDSATTAFKRAFAARGKSMREGDTATIGIAVRERRTRGPTSPPSCAMPLQTYPLCCRLQPPRPTCFAPRHGGVLPCYCHWPPPCPPQFFRCDVTSPRAL